MVTYVLNIFISIFCYLDIRQFKSCGLHGSTLEATKVAQLQTNILKLVHQAIDDPNLLWHWFNNGATKGDEPVLNQ